MSNLYPSVGEGVFVLHMHVFLLVSISVSYSVCETIDPGGPMASTEPCGVSPFTDRLL